MNTQTIIIIIHSNDHTIKKKSTTPGTFFYHNKVLLVPFKHTNTDEPHESIDNNDHIMGIQ